MTTLVRPGGDSHGLGHIADVDWELQNAAESPVRSLLSSEPGCWCKKVEDLGTGACEKLH